MDRRLHTPISKEGRFRFGKKIEEESHLLLLHQKSTTHCLQQNTARSIECAPEKTKRISLKTGLLLDKSGLYGRYRGRESK